MGENYAIVCYIVILVEINIEIYIERLLKRSSCASGVESRDS